MKIFHISAECYPIAKVGGLADAVGSLSKYQSKAGHSVSVVIPGYKIENIMDTEFEIVFSSHVKLGDFNFSFNVQKAIRVGLEFDFYIISIPEIFDRNEIYGYEDDIERFISFQKATLEWILSLNSIPNIINCHDHHTALIPFMLRYAFRYNVLKDIPVVLTIHNALYQGQFRFDKLHYFSEFELHNTHLLEWNGQINSLAVGLRCARAITTVSPSYLNELCHSGFGLESLFNEVKYKSKGILNGIDVEIWNPETDEVIEAIYNSENFEIGKQINKEKLCDLFNLDSKKPLFSFIGRLYEEKGADLLVEVVKKTLKKNKNKNKINILVLGSGNNEIEVDLTRLLSDYSGNYNCYIGFSEDLAHLIYAGSDFLLIPSRIESCGLNQMYAYRYGTIPIVRRVGGLQDTVIDIGDNGNGICHVQPSVEDICMSIDRGIDLYGNKKYFNEIRQSAMNKDYSWDQAYKKHLEIYNLILNKL